ncbi:acyltransferase family protein [Neobacillus sp. YIM B02564]|uniref:Acyltransferase family protein n=1 Tax=Neobacillus paridis TaxID=2803862 RepID=A0ABS1TJK5_9BACI|nr:acyltransferase family protein [Neobacillus paridis]MBL4950698.1 acyltransferase family protein [Neobacillus paridis]
MASSRRVFYFDNAKFILIFLVVFGHVISPIKDNDNVLFAFYSAIFLFHMPAFILISGYFSKGFKKIGYLLKTVKKMLLPYFIFQMLYSVYYYWNGDEPTLKFDLLQPHWTLWFLLSLFCWNLLLYVFARLRWAGFVIAVVIGIGIGYLDDVGSYLSLSRTFVFFPYFLLGFLLEPRHLKRIKQIKYSPAFGFVILLGTMLFISTNFPEDAIPWLLGDTSYAGMGVEELSDGLIRAFQYVITLIVIAGFLAIVPKTRFKMTTIGQRTLYIYLLHGFIIKTIQVFFSDDVLKDLSDHYFMLMAFSFGLCLLLGNYVIQKYTRPLIELRI